MIAIIGSILPISAFIATGWVMGRRGFPGGEFWTALDRLVYFVLLPALLLRTMAHVDLAGTGVLGIAAGAILPMLAMTVIAVMLRRVVAADGPAFSSVLQGVLRVNAYIGLAVADALHGAQGLGTFIVVLAFVVPTDNAISIFGLVRFAGAHHGTRVLGNVALNPLIVSIAAGMLLAVLDVPLPGALDEVLRLAGTAALPLALLAVGAGIRLDGVQAAYRSVAAACVLRQGGMPLLVLGTAALIGLDPSSRWALMLYASLSTGPAAYIVARQLGGDAPLMANIISATTITALVSVPFWLYVIG